MSVGQAAEAYRRELASCGQAVAILTHASDQPRITQSRIWFAKEPATRNLRLADPSLTLTRTQYPAIVCNTGNGKFVAYAELASPCNRSATTDRSLVMSRWAVRVPSSVPPIRLLQAKYTEFAKPSVRRRGFFDTTQQARLQG